MSERSNNAYSQTYYTNDEKVKILGLVIAVENQITTKKDDLKNYKSWSNVISRVSMSLSAICGNIG